VAGGGLQIAGDQLQKRALAGAVMADDPETLAFVDIQRNVT